MSNRERSSTVTRIAIAYLGAGVLHFLAGLQFVVFPHQIIDMQSSLLLLLVQLLLGLLAILSSIGLLKTYRWGLYLGFLSSTLIEIYIMIFFPLLAMTLLSILSPPFAQWIPLFIALGICPTASALIVGLTGNFLTSSSVKESLSKNVSEN
ncbi:MAG: hypothetical protein ACFFED_16660 [Candidatus Thorarchaeota archaeon]